jgi:hypothetical protein
MTDTPQVKLFYIFAAYEGFSVDYISFIGGMRYRPFCLWPERSEKDGPV